MSTLPLSNRSLDSLFLGIGPSHENPGSIHEGARVIQGEERDNVISQITTYLLYFLKNCLYWDIITIS